MKKTREEKIISAIRDNGFVVNGVHYRGVTVEDLMILEQFKSTYLDGATKLKGIMEVLYLTSNDPDVIDKLTQEQWDDSVKKFARELSVADLNVLAESVKQSSDNSSSTIVEVREESEKK